MGTWSASAESASTDAVAQRGSEAATGRCLIPVWLRTFVRAADWKSLVRKGIWRSTAEIGKARAVLRHDLEIGAEPLFEYVKSWEISRSMMDFATLNARDKLNADEMGRSKITLDVYFILLSCACGIERRARRHSQSPVGEMAVSAPIAHGIELKGTGKYHEEGLRCSEDQ